MKIHGSAIAIEIATEILTVHEPSGPKECTRAQMMYREGDGEETNRGGRNKQSLVGVIDGVLARHGFGED